MLKYALRFGIPLVGIFIFASILNPAMIGSILHKCCLILIGYTIAEVIWLVGYKKVFDEEERFGRVTDVGQVAILIFRGLLIASIIIGLTLGL